MASGVKKYRKSKTRVACKDPFRAEQRRSSKLMVEINRLINLRPDVKVQVVNKLVLSLQKEERADLRGMGAVMQERCVAVRDAVVTMEKENFNALNSIDLRSTLAMPLSTMMTVRERLACDMNGNRMVLARPPPYTGKGNPVTQKSNREQGIKWEQKNICVPYVFKNPKQIAQALDRVLEGHTLHLSFDFDAAAWDMWEMAHSLLTQLEFDKNLLELPEGVLRVMQLIFDGHGWTSRCGTVRFTLRCVHTIEDHNSTRNARDPIFALGTDKCADIAKVITVGGERSMQERMYKGLVIRQRAVEDLPWWVQQDTDFLNLA